MVVFLFSFALLLSGPRLIGDGLREFLVRQNWRERRKKRRKKSFFFLFFFPGIFEVCPYWGVRSPRDRGAGGNRKSVRVKGRKKFGGRKFLHGISKLDLFLGVSKSGICILSGWDSIISGDHEILVLSGVALAFYFLHILFLSCIIFYTVCIYFKNIFLTFL